MNNFKIRLKENTFTPKGGNSHSENILLETSNFSKTANGSDVSVECVIDKKIDSKLAENRLEMLTDEKFLLALKERLGIISCEPEFIDIPAVCRLFNISKVTCFKRTRLGIYIPYRVEGSRKVLYKKSQLLDTLKTITKFRRNTQ